jgi:hypothetical protein
MFSFGVFRDVFYIRYYHRTIRPILAEDPLTEVLDAIAAGDAR